MMEDLLVLGQKNLGESGTKRPHVELSDPMTG